jgi:hypothetical protein|tara:strand:- start:28 stop:360 length:333 start_codon:yes stop_codon:yes gene_type:complete
MSKKDMSEYYTYVENKGSTWTGIGLTDKAGKWQGVVYEYGKVTINEDEENDSASLQFEWNLLDSNGLGQEFFTEDFFNLIGDILHELIEQNLDKSGLLKDANDDNRKDNI